MDMHEEEWIAKYRAAASAEIAKRSRSGEFVSAFQRACNVLILNLRKVSALFIQRRTQVRKVAVQPGQALTRITVQPISQGEPTAKAS